MIAATIRFTLFSFVWTALSLGSVFADEKLIGETIDLNGSELIIHPVCHASFVLQFGGKTFYIDPIGGGELYKNLPQPDFVLITDEHEEHFDIATLRAVVDLQSRTKILAPKSVLDKYARDDRFLRMKTNSLKNKENVGSLGIFVQVLPTHGPVPNQKWSYVKNIGNGYLLWLADKGRVYISGKLESVPDPLWLKDIDVAILCLNQQHATNMNAAAEALSSFAPRIVFPYHYPNAKPPSDLLELDKLVEKIDVRVIDWHPSARNKPAVLLGKQVVGTWLLDIENALRLRAERKSAIIIEEEIVKRAQAARDRGYKQAFTFRLDGTVLFINSNQANGNPVVGKWRANEQDKTIQMVFNRGGRKDQITAVIVDSDHLRIQPISELAGLYVRNPSERKESSTGHP